MAEVKWIKIVTDIFDDEKILLIESLPEADSIIVIWFKLLCLAGKNNNNGVFLINDRIHYTDEMFATIFRRPLNTVRLALRTFEQYGMIEIINDVVTIPKWEKHQQLDALEMAREATRKRVAKHREKQRLLATGNVSGNVTEPVTVTQSNANRIDKNRIEENRIESISSSSSVNASQCYTAITDGYTETEIDARERDRDKNSTMPEDFARFWLAYPRKVSKVKALKAWEKLKPNDELVEAILMDIRTRQNGEWKSKDVQYIPHPSTYLNQRRWEDETMAQEEEWHEPDLEEVLRRGGYYPED